MPQVMTNAENDDDVEQLVREVTDLTGGRARGARPTMRRSCATTPSPRRRVLPRRPHRREGGRQELRWSTRWSGRRITESTSYGPGTETSSRTCTRRRPTARRRSCSSARCPGKFRIVTHDLAAAARQVLLDLPDIDSHYADHLELTRRMLRHMLFPVWIQSVEKYADQQPQKLLAAVAAGNDPANFVFVLNKADQVVAPRRATRSRWSCAHDFARGIAQTLAALAAAARAPDQRDPPGAVRPARAARAARAAEVDADRAAVAATSPGGSGRGRCSRGSTSRTCRSAPSGCKRLQDEAEELTAPRLGVPLLEASSRACSTTRRTGWRWSTTSCRAASRAGRSSTCCTRAVAPLTRVWRRNVGASARAARGRVARRSCTSTAATAPLAVARAVRRSPCSTSRTRRRRALPRQPAVGRPARRRRRRRPARTLVRRDGAPARRRHAAARRRRRDHRRAVPLAAHDRRAAVVPVRPAGARSDRSTTAAIRRATDTGRSLASSACSCSASTYLLKNVTFLLIWFAVLWLLLRWDTQRQVNRLLLKWRGAGRARPVGQPRGRDAGVDRRADRARSASRAAGPMRWSSAPKPCVVASRP